jgi:hypothetical protein
MANITPPYADPGRAAFQELDTHLQNFLLAGVHPELAPAIGFPLPNSVDYPQFAVLGLDAAGKLVWATEGLDPAAAVGTLTFSGVGTADDTITIGGVVYTLVAAADAEYEVTIGGTVTESAAALVAVINGTDANETPAHPDVYASNAAGVVTITARQVGLDGNSIATTESGTGTAFGAATLAGGRDQGGVQAVGVLAHAAALGASGTGAGLIWYSGNFNMDALVWHASFDTDAKKAAAFRGAPTPTSVIIGKR